LPLSHEIFSHHGNVTVEQKKDGTYAYLLGDFKTMENAQNFLNSIIIERYQGAMVVSYKNGYRKIK